MRILLSSCLVLLAAKLALHAGVATATPATDGQRGEPVLVWATEYHIHQVATDSGTIPLLSMDGKPLGPRLSASDFCHAALEGTLRFGATTYNVAGVARAEPQANCSMLVNRDVGRNRFSKTTHQFGDGVNGSALIPYKTLAADLNVFPAGTILYIPDAVGVRLPDGSQHDGYFTVADAGDMQGNHIDVFEGMKVIPFPFVHSQPTPPVQAFVAKEHTPDQSQEAVTRASMFFRALSSNADTATVAPPPPPPPAEAPAAPTAPPNKGLAASSNTLPDSGKPREDYVPCLFSNEARLRFKNAVDLVGLTAILKRQALIGRITANDEQIRSVLLTLRDPSDAGSLLSTLADMGLVKQARPDRTLEDARNAIYSALLGAGATRPAFDVSCSQSVMTFKETSDIFGKRIAERYVAIQVTVRNVNPNQEFLMQDVQVAVDYDTEDGGARLDHRFVAGRDKLLVRGVALRGQSDDPRNRFIRIAEALGDIASASTIGLKALDLRNGISVYRSAFLPGLKNIFPDYTVEQLNRLNDMAFSANTSYKLVVGKSGSAPLVTFVPAEIFADRYATWTSQQLNAFNEKVYVAFSGVHIAEQSSSEIAATDLSCPTDTRGNVDLSQGSGTTNCTLKGTNLGSIDKLRLRNAHESTDAAVVEADLSSSGSVKWNTAELKALTGTEYSVFLVDNSGHEIPTRLTLNFAPPTLP